MEQCKIQMENYPEQERVLVVGLGLDGKQLFSFSEYYKEDGTMAVIMDRIETKLARLGFTRNKG